MMIGQEQVVSVCVLQVQAKRVLVIAELQRGYKEAAEELKNIDERLGDEHLSKKMNWVVMRMII